MSERPMPFRLIQTKYGPFVVNTNDYMLCDNNTKGYGVGFQLMNKGEYDPEEIELSRKLLESRLNSYGPGVVVVDCGANLGVFSVAWSKALEDQGTVYAFEAQEKIYYALAANIILHNCFNVKASHAAVGAEDGWLMIPEPDYTKHASFGSLEIVKRENSEDIGQVIDYANPTLKVRQVTIDSLELPRLDLLKIDVEGMEMAVLKGAAATITRCKPQVFVEVLKSDKSAIAAFFRDLGYTRSVDFGLNILFLHDTDPLVIQTEAPKEVVSDVH